MLNNDVLRQTIDYEISKRMDTLLDNKNAPIFVKVKPLVDDLELPKYETMGSAGMDVRSTEDLILKAGERKLVKTGISVKIPSGYHIDVRARSGLALKHGITVLNGVGTVDEDFTGEIGVILINHSNIDFEIKKGDRIAQIVLLKTQRIEWQYVNELPTTDRGSGGFNSTGVK